MTRSAAAPDGDRVAGLDAAVLRRHVAGGEDVGQEQHLLVGQAIGDFDRTDVGERYTGVLSLPPGVAAVQVRVAVDRRGRVAVSLFGQQRVRVGVVAQAPLAVPAVIAVAAADGEGDDHAVADLEVLDLATKLHDDTHELVAQDITLLHRRDKAVV